MTAPLLIYTTKSGNTRTFVQYLSNKLDFWIAKGFDSSIEDYNVLILGSYTWGAGKIPAEMKRFLIVNKNLLRGKKVFVFGSGNSIYPKFCAAVDGIAKIVTDCGAEVIEIFKFEQRFNEDENKTEVDKFLQKLSKYCK